MIVIEVAGRSVMEEHTSDVRRTWGMRERSRAKDSSTNRQPAVACVLSASGQQRGRGVNGD